MMAEKKFDKLITQVFRFGIVGAISFFIDYGLMLLFTEILGINYLLSSGFSFSISVVINYVLSVKWVFTNKKEHKKVVEIVVFIALSIVGLLLNELYIWSFTEKVALDYRWSKILATGFVMVWNFISRKLFLEKRDRYQKD